MPKEINVYDYRYSIAIGHEEEEIIRLEEMD